MGGLFGRETGRGGDWLLVWLFMGEYEEVGEMRRSDIAELSTGR